MFYMYIKPKMIFLFLQTHTIYEDSKMYFCIVVLYPVAYDTSYMKKEK